MTPDHIIDHLIALTLHSPEGGTYTVWSTDDDNGVPLIITINPDGTFEILDPTA